METTSIQRTMEFCCFQKDSLEKKFCRLNEFKIKIFYLLEDLEGNVWISASSYVYNRVGNVQTF